jgi:holliday junction DNA helicase RuvA
VIASIEGVVRGRDGNRIVVEVGGVGLEVLVPLRMVDSFGPAGSPVRLHTYLVVREDALTLYGFPDENERRLFQTLLGVSGVGPKLALSVLSASSAGEIARLIRDEKTKTLMTLPGIGKKTAERIVLELKDKIEIERYLPEAPAAEIGLPRDLLEEALTALESLGMSRSSAVRTLEKVPPEKLREAARVEDVVREALKQM